MSGGSAVSVVRVEVRHHESLQADDMQVFTWDGGLDELIRDIL
jgi:hypothetical protein